MNFIPFTGALSRGTDSVEIGSVRIGIPAVAEDVGAGALALGVRPEHIRLRDEGGLRGAVYETEYLGTNQIVSIEMAQGIVKARVPSDRTFQRGQHVGLDLDSRHLSLFVGDSGRAITTDGEAAHG